MKLKSYNVLECKKWVMRAASATGSPPNEKNIQVMFKTMRAASATCKPPNEMTTVIYLRMS